MAIQNLHDVLKFVESEPDQPLGGTPDHTHVSVSSSIVVRPYHLRDSGILKHLPLRHELHFPESTYEQPGFAQLALRRMLHAENSDLPLYVAVDGNERVGALQCARHSADDRWHLRFLALAERREALGITAAMLEHAIVSAGQCGARRILSRITVDSSLLPAMLSVGFSTYGREQVLLLNPVRILPARNGVRPQSRSDVWSVHQLYIQTTPRDVQNAEALTSHAWDVDIEGRTQRGWLLATEYGVGAYVRVRTSRHYHVLDVLVAPEMRSELPRVLSGVGMALAQETPRPIYLLLHGYQRDLANGIEGDLVSEQHLMVKYTTATSHGSLRYAETFELLRPAEADPQRVPSFSVRSQHERN